jgi:hypothetical protein
MRGTAPESFKSSGNRAANESNHGIEVALGCNAAATPVAGEHVARAVKPDEPRVVSAFLDAPGTLPQRGRRRIRIDVSHA